MSVVDSGRRAAESLMTDTFAAYSPRQTKVDGLDETVYDPQGSTPGKSSGTSVTGRDTITRHVLIGGVERPVVEGGLQIPISAPLPVAGDQGIGWEYECTAVGPASDPQMVGRRWLVVNVPVKSYATARRLDVVEIPQPEV